jgi:hypothetical protein
MLRALYFLISIPLAVGLLWAMGEPKKDRPLLIYFVVGLMVLFAFLLREGNPWERDRE